MTTGTHCPHGPWNLSAPSGVAGARSPCLPSEVPSVSRKELRSASPAQQHQRWTQCPSVGFRLLEPLTQVLLLVQSWTGVTVGCWSQRVDLGSATISDLPHPSFLYIVCPLDPCVLILILEVSTTSKRVLAQSSFSTCLSNIPLLSSETLHVSL